MLKNFIPTRGNNVFYGKFVFFYSKIINQENDEYLNKINF